MIDLNKLTDSLEDIQQSITQVSDNIKQLEKILINSNFPIAINVFCFVDENGVDIYLYWDKEKETEYWGLLATKVWVDDTGICSANKRMDELKVIPKMLVYPYLPQLVQKIEQKAEELKNIIKNNSL